MVLRLIFISLLVAGCGRVYHSGQVDHVFQLEADKLETYFRASCEATVAPELVEACVVKRIGDFLTALSSISGNSTK
jgi:hypothetical protein